MLEAGEAQGWTLVPTFFANHPPTTGLIVADAFAAIRDTCTALAWPRPLLTPEAAVPRAVRAERLADLGVFSLAELAARDRAGRCWLSRRQAGTAVS